MNKTRKQPRYAGKFAARPLAERFWEKVNRDGPVPEHRPELGPCWVWTAAKHGSFGYGGFYQDGRFRSAHVVSWEMENGPVPPGLFVCHHCDNPPCVRPAHLFVGTQSDNMLDSVRKGRAKWTHKYGDTHGSSILTSVQVGNIRERLAQGDSIPQIAIAFGVSKGAILHIKHNRTWHDPDYRDPAPAVLRTHCPHGHEYSEENVYRWRGTGHRICRTCVRERSVRRRQAARLPESRQ